MVLTMLVVERLEPPAPEPVPHDDDVLVLRVGLDDEQAARARALQAFAVPPTQVSPEDYHIVREGETLGDIALSRLGSAVLAAEIARLNRLEDPDELEIGQILFLR